MSIWDFHVQKVDDFQFEKQQQHREGHHQPAAEIMENEICGLAIGVFLGQGRRDDSDDVADQSNRDGAKEDQDLFPP